MGKINNMPKDLLKFLDAADEDFIYAYETRRYGVLANRFTQKATNIIMRMVNEDGGTRYFGKRNMRTTTWEILEDEGDRMVVLKTCIYKNIHVTFFKTIKASEDYSCEWTIIQSDDNAYGWKVNSIGQEDLLYDD